MPFTLIAHRGYSDLAPENTLPAFDLALERGYPQLELDVQLTRDGIPVIIHDDTLNCHQLSRSARNDPEPPLLVVVERRRQFRVRVHDERPVPRDRLPDRFPAEDQQVERWAA